MENGLYVNADSLLASPKGGDISITFWLRLTQDSTGHHRTLLARGHKTESWPVLLLRDLDRRIEVIVQHGGEGPGGVAAQVE